MHACMHDPELHGHVGLLMHAQLALAASSPRGTSLRGVKDVGVKWMPGCGRRARVGMPKGMPVAFEIDARAWTEPMGAASYALLHDEGDAASAQDDALEVVPQMAAVAERGPKQVGMPLPVQRGAATATTGERDDENELSDSSDSVDVGVKDVGVKDVDDESEGHAGSEGQMESEERGRGRGGRRKRVWRCARRGE